MTPPHPERAGDPRRRPPRQAKSLTIGAVCKALQQEFPDISISKIRYLEDQKLLTPRRTPGGYRLYSAGDDVAAAHDPAPAARRVPAAGGDPAGARGGALGSEDTSAPRRRRRTGARARGGAAAADVLRSASAAALYSLEDVVEETGAEPRLVQELEDFGIVQGEVRGRHALLRRDRARDRARGQGARRYGVAGRNLRVFKSSAEREAALLQQILAPALRSRNPERRKEAVEALENLAAVASHLKHLLLVRDLRKIAEMNLGRSSATSRTSRSRGSCSRTSRRCCSSRRRWTPPCARARRWARGR